VNVGVTEPKITRVLLADGWHECERFGLDSYEFGYYYWDHDWGRAGAPRFECEHGGGQSGVCSAGFAFTDKTTGLQIAGPLTAILAVAGTASPRTRSRATRPSTDEARDLPGAPGVYTAGWGSVYTRYSMP
jgi:hypothetical protein